MMLSLFFFLHFCSYFRHSVDFLLRFELVFLSKIYFRSYTLQSEILIDIERSCDRQTITDFEDS